MDPLDLDKGISGFWPEQAHLLWLCEMEPLYLMAFFGWFFSAQVSLLWSFFTVLPIVLTNYKHESASLTLKKYQ